MSLYVFMGKRVKLIAVTLSVADNMSTTKLHARKELLNKIESITPIV